MHLEERLEFIDSLASLPLQMAPAIRAFSSPETPPHDINKPSASAMPNTVNVFMPGVSEQIIDDVDLCKLIMQNDASKKFPEDSQLFDWYKHYVNGLGKLGWVIQNRNIQEVTIRKTGLTMDQVALDIAAGMIGANAANILANVGKQAVDAVKNNPGAIKIFERDKKLGTQAKFDVAPVWVDGSGQANMILNCISLDARESTRGILFWKSTRASTTIKSGAVRAYLNTSIFTLVHEKHATRYTQQTDELIEDLGDFD
ncbi:hypothetical protein D3C76_622440 [compost metagenome]